jgi:hypothetical protein
MNPTTAFPIKCNVVSILSWPKITMSSERKRQSKLQCLGYSEDGLLAQIPLGWTASSLCLQNLNVVAVAYLII